MYGFKCFLTPSGVNEFHNVSAADLNQAMPVLAELRAPLLVHAEMPAVIEAAARLKGDLNAALRETRVDPAFHTSRRRSYDEILPWEIVNSGLSREFMQREDERAHEARSTAPCPSVNQCTRCGVCPTTWLAEAPAALVQLKAFATLPVA